MQTKSRENVVNEVVGFFPQKRTVISTWLPVAAAFSLGYNCFAFWRLVCRKDMYKKWVLC